MLVTQIFICSLQVFLITIPKILADDTNGTASNEGKSKIQSRVALKKTGIYNRAGMDPQIAQENIGYAAPQPYINYQAAIDEDEEYQREVQAAGLRSAMESPSYNVNNVKAAFPYNFNNFDNNNAMLGSVYVSQATNSAPIRQNDLQKSVDSKSVATGGAFQNQGVQFNNDLAQSQFTSNFPQGNNFGTYPQTSTFTVSTFNNNNNNNFEQATSTNFNGNQGMQQNVNDISAQLRNNNNNNNNLRDANGQKATVFKITTSNQAPLANLANLAPLLSNGFSGNLIATMPQGMVQHAFVPAVAFAPQMGFGGMNFFKPHGSKQTSLNKVAMMSNTVQNNPGIIGANTLTVPMFYGNMGANRLSSPHPAAFSPFMYPGPIFFPFAPYGHPLQRNRGSGSSSSSKNNNKSRSENRDDRDDAEDLFEDDPVDLDSDE